MAKELVSDVLWEIVEPLLPDEPPKPEGGRPRIDDRAALSGILFVLKSGIPWEMLPQEMAAEAESPVGDAYASGTRPEYGRSCIESSWIVLERQSK
jgi:transposase